MLIGTTDDAIYGDSSGEGIVLRSGECIDINRTGDSMLNLNRLGSDGPIMNFRRDGSVKAALGTRSNAFCIDVNGSERLRIRSDGKLGINTTTTNDSSELLCLMGPSGDNATIGIKCNSTTHAGILSFHDTAGTFRGRVQYSHNTDHMQFNTAGSERLRIGSSGQIGVAGANFGTARQTIVSGGASGAVSWSSNPFLLDMDSLGDIDYDGVFLRYRETADVTGNGLVYLGLCKSTTNCTPGRIGIPVGFIPGVTYNSHFRVDKVGITPWPDGGGHRYEFYVIISDWVSTGKLGIFYLTNSTN